MLQSRRWHFERVTVAAFAALLVLASGHFFVRDLRLASITRAAERVHEGMALDAEVARQLSSHAGLHRAATDCRGVSPSATLQLAALDVLTDDDDPLLRARLLERARATLAFQLACLPLDGAAWLSYGRLLMDLDGPNPQALGALERSARAAPAEVPVLRARVPYLQWLYAAGYGEIAPLFTADLGIVVRHLRPSSLAWLYAQAPASVRPLYRDLLGATATPRRLAVERQLDRIDQLPAK